MKLRQLEAIRAVINRGTTTHAAKALGLTQSALVDTFVDVLVIVPASTLWFVPSNFKSTLGVLNTRQSSIGD